MEGEDRWGSQSLVSILLFAPSSPPAGNPPFRLIHACPGKETRRCLTRGCWRGRVGQAAPGIDAPWGQEAPAEWVAEPEPTWQLGTPQ